MFNISRKIIKKDLSGSALLLTMFILAGMLIVAMSGAYVILLGIKAGGIQAQSTKAYYAAEAGAEHVLYKLRRGGWEYEIPSNLIVFSATLPNSGASYKVYYTSFPPLIFTSVGEYNQTKRSVEVIIGT